MIIFKILLGIALLTAGYDLFWLFVAGIGFIFGFDLIAPLLPGLPLWKILLLAAGTGFLGALFAILCQKCAIVVAGVIAGGYIFLYLWQEVGPSTGQISGLFFVIGGVTGGILARTVFDWALIILSSFTGATLIIHALPLELSAKTLLFSLLTVIGIVIQSSYLIQEPQRYRRKT